MPKIKTGGIERKEDYILFLACTMELKNFDGSRYRHKLTSLLDMSEGHESHFRSHIERGDQMFLDSGVFGLTNNYKRMHGCTMDEALKVPPEKMDGYDKLWNRYIAFNKEWGDKLWGYVELDLGGVATKRKTRQKLHDLGLSPIPVFHPLNDGWDYFHELAENYDRICLGNLVQANKAVRVAIMAKAYALKQKYPGLWIHCLGVGYCDLCTAFPFESFDASSWSSPLRYPKRFSYSCYRTLRMPESMRVPIGDAVMHTKNVEEISEEHRYMYLNSIEHRRRNATVDMGEVRSGWNALLAEGYFDQILPKNEPSA